MQFSLWQRSWLCLQSPFLLQEKIQHVCLWLVFPAYLLSFWEIQLPLCTYMLSLVLFNPRWQWHAFNLKGPFAGLSSSLRHFDLSEVLTPASYTLGFISKPWAYHAFGIFAKNAQLNLVMRKHQMNPNWERFYKTTSQHSSRVKVMKDEESLSNHPRLRGQKNHDNEVLGWIPVQKMDIRGNLAESEQNT